MTDAVIPVPISKDNLNDSTDEIPDLYVHEEYVNGEWRDQALFNGGENEAKRLTRPYNSLGRPFSEGHQIRDKSIKDALAEKGVENPGRVLEKAQIEALEIEADAIDKSKDADEQPDSKSTDPLFKQYGKERVEAARNLLEDELLLNEIRAVLDFEAAGEYRNKLFVFLSALTKDFDKPLATVGVGKQAEGKSYITKGVLELFPDDEIENLTEATKASIYRIAQQEGPGFFKGKILYLGEIPDDDDDREEIFSIFRQLISEGRVEKWLTMDTGEGQERVKLVLDGSPALLTTAVNPSMDNQMQSRVAYWTPAMNEAQDEYVRYYQQIQEELPEDTFYPARIQELKQEIKIALTLLKREGRGGKEILNPWTQVIEDSLIGTSDNIKRDRPKVFKLIKAVTHLHRRQRPAIKVNGKEQILVSWKDVVLASWILEDVLSNIFGDLREYSRRILQAIEENHTPTGLSYDEALEGIRDEEEHNADCAFRYWFDSADVANWTGIHKSTIQDHLRVLAEKGYIVKDRNHRPHRHVFPEDQGETGGETALNSDDVSKAVSNRKKLRESFFSRHIKKVLERGGGGGDLEDVLAEIEPESDNWELSTPMKQVAGTPSPLWEIENENLTKPAKRLNPPKNAGEKTSPPLAERESALGSQGMEKKEKDTESIQESDKIQHYRKHLTEPSDLSGFRRCLACKQEIQDLRPELGIHLQQHVKEDPDAPNTEDWLNRQIVAQVSGQEGLE